MSDIEDTKKAVTKWWQRWLCPLGFHDYAYHQELFVTHDPSKEEHQTEVVIAWDQCHCCSKSKLVHILK